MDYRQLEYRFVGNVASWTASNATYNTTYFNLDTETQLDTTTLSTWSLNTVYIPTAVTVPGTVTGRIIQTARADDHRFEGRPLEWPMLNTAPTLRNNRTQYLADGAAARAMALLHSCLNDEQRDMLRTQGKFRIVSNLGNIFEIREGRMHNIYKLDMAGKPIENWCVLPQGELAPGDAMLAQKLWLESDEAETERCANITLVATGQLTRLAPIQYQPGVFVPELALN